MFCNDMCLLMHPKDGSAGATIAQCRGDDKGQLASSLRQQKTEHPRHIRLTTCRFDNPSQTSSQSSPLCLYHSLRPFGPYIKGSGHFLDYQDLNMTKLQILLPSSIYSVVDISFTSCLLGALLILKNITSRLPWKYSRTSTWRCWTGTFNSTVRLLDDDSGRRISTR